MASSLSLCVCVSLCPLLTRTQVTGFRATGIAVHLTRGFRLGPCFLLRALCFPDESGIPHSIWPLSICPALSPTAHTLCSQCITDIHGCCIPLCPERFCPLCLECAPCSSPLFPLHVKSSYASLKPLPWVRVTLNAVGIVDCGVCPSCGPWVFPPMQLRTQWIAFALLLPASPPT